MVSVDSPERALGALPALEGGAEGAFVEACASLEDEAPTGEPPLDDEVAIEALPPGKVGGLRLSLDGLASHFLRLEGQGHSTS